MGIIPVAEKIMSLLPKVKSLKQTGVFSLIQKIKTMTGRKLEEVDSEIPAKKICVEENSEGDKNGESGVKKVKKGNVALLLGYCGKNYRGMQKNPNCKTVEEELLTALHKANCIPAEALSDLITIHFQRAARTDKGVSAVKQIVNFKAGLNYNIDEINSFLPEDIKVFAIKRVTKGFNAKNDCTSRTYSYTLPTYALSPEIHKEVPKDFRITSEMIENTNKILNQFLGTKNFYNFTSRKNFYDPSAKRFIMKFTAGEPFVNEMEFITLSVKGQSFMLHQIRKMVGYTIAKIKRIIPNDFESCVWNEKKLAVPMAPSLGLVLEDLDFAKYNKKFGNDGLHEPLVWEEEEPEITKFKNSHITTHIIKTECEQNVMFDWLQGVQMYSYTTANDNPEACDEQFTKDDEDVEKVSVKS